MNTTTSYPVHSGRIQPIARAGGLNLSVQLMYLYLVWFVILTDVHRWLAERGPRITSMHQAVPFLIAPLAVIVIARLPTTLGGNRRRFVWHAPFLCFLLAMMISSEFAMIPERSWSQVKIIIVFYILFVASLLLINTPQRLIPVLFMVVGQFWWWGWHSGMTGVVWWHPTYANFDGFGPLVVIGLPLCLFFGLASKSTLYRLSGFFLGGFCALAMVTSFARGVILSGAFVAVVAIFRSPRRNRVKITAALMLGAVTFVITSESLHPGGGVWAEVKSAFEEGKDEGTGADRWELWTKALKVWQAHPIIGVGAEHAGIVASHMIRDGRMEAEGYYGERRWAMWGRALHNVWVQILSEFGALGFLAAVWLLVDFWRRNAALRSQEFAEHWARVTRGKYHLPLIALGLECAMIAYVVTGMFYNQLFENWFWTLLLVNLLAYQHAKPPRVAKRWPAAHRAPSVAISPSPRNLATRKI